ncbi:MAG: PepSY domain-containing protein [Thermomonas sp.]
MPCCPTPSLKLLTIAILAVLPAISAHAGPQAVPQQQDSRQERDGSRQDRGTSRNSSSLSDAVRRIERDTRGEVLSAERVQYDGRDMHRVKVVDDAGRVRVFMQDPSRRDDDAGSNRNNSRSDRKSARGSQQDQTPTRDRDD